MKNNFKYLVSAMLVAASGAIVTSCDDWTEVKPVDINYNSVDKAENYPAYLAALRDYRSSDHKQVYAWIDAPADGPESQGHRLTALPDSVDVVVFMSPNAVSATTAADMKAVRADKGMRVVYTIDYSDLKARHTAMAEVATEEAPAPSLVEFLADTLTTALSYAKAQEFDGVMFAYNGKETIHLSPAELAQYKAEQNLFFNIVADWHRRFPQFTIDYLGYPQYLTNEDLINEFDFLFVRQGLEATNADLFSYYLTLAAGGVAPADKLGMMVSCTSLDPVDVKTGVFTDGSLAIDGLAKWVAGANVKAVGIYNAYTDYFSTAGNYSHVRAAIQAANPGVK